MTDKERQQAARKFAAYWQEHGKEKSEKDSFWLNLLREMNDYINGLESILNPVHLHGVHNGFTFKCSIVRN